MPYVVLLGLGLTVAFQPTLFSAFRLMQVNAGDTRLVNFILEHSYRWFHGLVTLRPISLWDQPMFFPVSNVAAYTEVLLGSAPIYWLFRVLRFAPDTSLQLWMIAVVALDFASMSLFLRNCVGFGDLASATGGFLFAFASPRVAQMDHQQLLPQFFTILALYGLFRLFRPQRMTARQGAFVFFLCSAAQLWAGFYLGWFLFFGALVAGTWTLCLRRYRKPLIDHLVQYRRTIALAALSSLIVIAPMLHPYSKALREVGPRSFSGVTAMIPPPQSWIYLGQTWLYSWQDRVGLFQRITYANEQLLGIGWVTLIMAAAGLYLFHKEQRSWATLMLVSALTILVLVTRYPGGFMPWKYAFEVVPGAKAIRAVSRVVVLMLVPFSIGFAYLIESRKTAIAALALVGIGFAEQRRATPAYDKIQIRADVSRLADHLRSDCIAFYYSPAYEKADTAVPPQYKLQIDALWAALQANIPTVNGYSGNLPRGWWELWENKLLSKADFERIGSALERWNARYGLDPAKVCWVRSL